MHVSKLSHNPPAILASVFADKGAITMISAHRRSSMWSTLSPILFQLDHSSSSV
uniref:Uncharacterized protein n=1 Tax=Rhizophora mucronata TaxID=61149 RepID=A0A2P2ILR3_RHIMU